MHAVYVVTIFNVHHSGTQLSLGNEGTFHRPENLFAPFSGGVIDIGPKGFCCIKVRTPQVFADLEVEVRRRSPRV